MGYFLAVSAFRGLAPTELATAVCEYAREHDVGGELGDGEPGDPSTAVVYAPKDGWTVVLWPPYFNVHDVPLCSALSGTLGVVASTVHVVDDDYWVHTLCADGRVVDRFCSEPEVRPVGWEGDAEALARELGADGGVLRAYLTEPRPARAFPDDEFTLDDFWVFTDFWRRLGVPYPDDVGAYELAIQFADDFGDRLPETASEP